MIISPSKEFIFIHLEKCGGTSIETALEPHLAWYDMIMGSSDFGEGVQDLYFKRFGIDTVKQKMLWKHSSAKDIHYFIGPDEWKNFKKLSVVRNPQLLVESLYNFSQTVVKYHMGRVNRELWKEKLRTKNFPQLFPLTEKYVLSYIQSVIDGSGINGFVEDLLDTDHSFLQSQTSRLMINNVNDLGIVADLSELNNRWTDITQQIGFDFEIDLPHLNFSESSLEELSPRAIKKIKKHFAIDYQVLPRYTGVYWD